MYMRTELKLLTRNKWGTFENIYVWADEVRKLKIRTNADTPKDAIQARKFGAEGIGLCRMNTCSLKKKESLISVK